MDEIQQLENHLNIWKGVQLWAPVIGLVIFTGITIKVNLVEKQIERYGESSAMLIKEANKLIGELREFVERHKSQQIDYPMTPEMFGQLPPAQLQQIWDSYTRIGADHVLKLMSEYNERFKVKTQVLRDKLQERIKPEHRRPQMDIAYFNPGHYMGLEQIIDDLQRMTFFLEDQTPTLK